MHRKKKNNRIHTQWTLRWNRFPKRKTENKEIAHFFTYIFVCSPHRRNFHFFAVIPSAASRSRQPSRTDWIWEMDSVWLTTWMQIIDRWSLTKQKRNKNLFFMIMTLVMNSFFCFGCLDARTHSHIRLEWPTT